MLNALFLKNAGFGDYVDSLSEKDLPYFLYNLDNYKKKLDKNKTNPEEIFGVFDKILKKIKK